jgi:SAM-dependent methyltransferase
VDAGIRRELTADLRERVSTEEERIRDIYGRRGHALARDSWAEPGHVFMLAERDWKVLRALRREGWMPLGNRSLLDVGCGTGSFLRDFVRWGADPSRLVGIDLRPEALAAARATLPPEVRLLCESATALPFPDASFDIVLQASVLTSIKDPLVRQRAAAEMRRMVKPEGAILWFDFRYDNPFNPDVWGLSRGDIHRLFPHARITLASVCLAPPFVRPVARRSWVLAALLSLIPPLRSHYLGIIRPY